MRNGSFIYSVQPPLPACAGFPVRHAEQSRSVGCGLVRWDKQMTLRNFGELSKTWLCLM